jgi:carboxymethylenebutenolidase
MKTSVDLATADGPCPTALFIPDQGPGPWPGVVFCIDGGGPRPALDQMAARIAAMGYAVALPDLFHRAGSVFDLYPPGVPRDMASFFTLFAEAGFRERWRREFYASATDPKHLQVDVGAVLAHLASLPSVRPGPVGVTGYCMGGNCALRIAALFGERIALAASFHGGMLATTQPDSPHLLAASIKARVYAACAVEDSSCTEEMQQRLEAALTQAHVEHRIETYPGARHGFAVPDSPVFDAGAAQRHSVALEAELGGTLRRAHRGAGPS